MLRQSHLLCGQARRYLRQWRRRGQAAGTAIVKVLMKMRPGAPEDVLAAQL